MGEGDADPQAAPSGHAPAEEEDVAALEALADEIELTAEAQADPDLPPAALLPPVGRCWETAFDGNSQRWYWFNRALGTSQWHPPDGWAQQASGGTAWGHHAAAQQAWGAAIEAAAETVEAGAGAAAAPAPVHTCAPGYYYRDSYGVEQGPFSREQLLQWREALPMDLRVRHVQAAAPPAAAAEPTAVATAEAAADQAEFQLAAAPAALEQAEQGLAAAAAGGRPAEAAAAGMAPAAAPDPDVAGTAAVEGGMQDEPTELAALLGDGELLAQWRELNPEQASTPCSAPPAPHWERQRVASSASLYAEAALAGLPADDDAVQVARLAAQAGRSIQEVVAWTQRAGGSGCGGDYASTAYHGRGTGRLRSAGAGASEGLYGDLGSWADPILLESQLARAAERRKRQLSRAELAEVRAHKAELKRKKERAWLLS